MEQTITDTEAAYAELAKMTDGTSEYYQALGAFLSLLFHDGKPPISLAPDPELAVSLPSTQEVTER